MNKENNIVTKRREKILDYLKINGELSTNELSEKFHISPLTLRRDLQTLEKEGLVIRYYGGAKLANINKTREFTSKNDILSNKKHCIAKHAASLIQDGDTIFINSSSTALLILNYLGDKRVNVITNNGHALELDLGPNIELILTGGQVYPRKQSLIGEFATYIFTKIAANKCFLGVSGISADFGITTSVIQETLVNREMIKNCNGPTYILTDSSKVGKRLDFSSGEIDEISHLITDSDISKTEIENLEAKGVGVISLDYTAEKI